MTTNEAAAKLVQLAYELVQQAHPEVLRSDGMTEETYRWCCEALFKAACRSEWAAEQVRRLELDS